MDPMTDEPDTTTSSSIGDAQYQGRDYVGDLDE